jgi:hypothetical protein
MTAERVTLFLMVVAAGLVAVAAGCEVGMRWQASTETTFAKARSIDGAAGIRAAAAMERMALAAERQAEAIERIAASQAETAAALTRLAPPGTNDGVKWGGR